MSDNTGNHRFEVNVSQIVKGAETPVRDQAKSFADVHEAIDYAKSLLPMGPNLHVKLACRGIQSPEEQDALKRSGLSLSLLG
jgi:hypothetical protein